MWTAITKAALSLAKGLLKKKAREKLTQNAGSIILVLLAVIGLLGVMIYALISSFTCTLPLVECGDSNKKTDVVSYDDRKEIASRIKQMRSNVNSTATVSGENYHDFEVIVSKSEEIKDKVEEGMEDTSAEKTARDSLSVTDSFPTADPNQWLTGKLDGLNETFKGRLAYLAQTYSQKINVSSGYRSIEEQRILWEGSDKSGKWVAAPGRSRHNYGLAIDTSSFPRYNMSSTQLEKFGLYKPMSYENWHIEPVETKGKTAEQLGGLNLGDGPTGSGDYINEALVHLLAFKQADDFGFTFYTLTAEKMKKEVEKKTNMGMTWDLATKIKAQVKNGIYKHKNVTKQAKEDEWKMNQYLNYARWEIQKCYMIGDKSEQGLWEKIVGGPTPCADMKEIVGYDIVPSKYQGSVIKTKESTECIETKDGKCVKSRKVIEVVYPELTDVLHAYSEVGLWKDKEAYKKYIDDVITYLYKEIFGSDSLLTGDFAPPYIVPMEDKTYKKEVDFGEEYEVNGASKKSLGVQMVTKGKNVPVYASASGVVLAKKNDPNFGLTVLIDHGNKYFTQYSGLSDATVDVGENLSQGQLIGAISDTRPLEFQVCQDAYGQKNGQLCAKHVDPELDPANLDFSSSLDDKTIKKRIEDYKKWRNKAINGEVFIMPGFETDFGMGFNGIISEKYETNFRGAGFCSDGASWDTYGGDSCGSWQLSSKQGSMFSFTQWTKSKFPQYYQYLSVDTPRAGQGAITQRHRDIWTRLGKDPNFKKAQFMYTSSVYFNTPAPGIQKKTGVDITKRHRAVKEMFFSICIHAGGGGCTNIAVSSGIKGTDSDRVIIEKVMAAKMRKYPQFNSRQREELKDLLGLLEGKPVPIPPGIKMQ